MYYIENGKIIKVNPKRKYVENLDIYFDPDKRLEISAFSGRNSNDPSRQYATSVRDYQSSNRNRLNKKDDIDRMKRRRFIENFKLTEGSSLTAIIIVACIFILLCLWLIVWMWKK